MTVLTKTLNLETQRQFEIVDITAMVEDVLKQSKITSGVVTIFSNHTTASIRLNHLEPLLLQDIMKIMYRLVPMEANYAHDFFEIRTKLQANERTNGHAHLKAFLLGSSQSIPVVDKKMFLGYRQSIFFVEFDGGRKRDYTVTVMGE